MSSCYGTAVTCGKCGVTGFGMQICIDGSLWCVACVRAEIKRLQTDVLAAMHAEIERLQTEVAELREHADRPRCDETIMRANQFLNRRLAHMAVEADLLRQTLWHVPESIRLQAEDDARRQRLEGGAACGE
ncbi:MAG: hypothetical protein FJ276_35010 [Planctomycetes bacterium]|nr:hypothetical protein [Planctomycetota bacterium]